MIISLARAIDANASNGGGMPSVSSFLPTAISGEMTSSPATGAGNGCREVRRRAPESR